MSNILQHEMLASKKIYRLDTVATLRNMQVGETIAFKVAGDDAETSAGALRQQQAKLRNSDGSEFSVYAKNGTAVVLRLK